jgi:hypothetical protein
MLDGKKNTKNIIVASENPQEAPTDRILTIGFTSFLFSSLATNQDIDLTSKKSEVLGLFENRYLLENTGKIMASLSQAKTLGGVGSILVLLGAVPSVGFILAIVGFIMILVAVKNVSETLSEPKIFNDMIISVLMAIIGWSFSA